jgi:hypothetical protein
MSLYVCVHVHVGVCMCIHLCAICAVCVCMSTFVLVCVCVQASMDAIVCNGCKPSFALSHHNVPYSYTKSCHTFLCLVKTDK